MSLERHKAKYNPTVDFSGDGRLFLTDREGSFPLRVKSKSQDVNVSSQLNNERASGKIQKYAPSPWDDALWTYKLQAMGAGTGNGFASESSYFSQDATRESQRKYRPKKVSNYERAMMDLTGSISSRNSNSLKRRLKRSKESKITASMDDFSLPQSWYSNYDPADYSNSYSKRFKDGKKARSRPSSASLSRNSSRYRSLDVNALRRIENNPFETDDGGFSFNKPNGFAHVDNVSLQELVYLPRQKLVAFEHLPFVLFVVLGIIVFLCGLTRLLFSFWHEYFHLLWAGILLLIFGLSGHQHNRRYTSHPRSLTYILLAGICAILTIVSTALTLTVFVPCVKELALGHNASEVVEAVTFSNWNKTLISVSGSAMDSLVYLSLALDAISLLCVLLCYYSLTCMMVAIDNYWDACFTTTEQCDHRGKPRFFNPLEQVTLCQASVCFGLVTIAFNFVEDSSLFVSPVWGPCLMAFAALFSIFYGKRPEVFTLGYFSSFLQICGMFSCCITVVLLSFTVVTTVSELYEDRTAYTRVELILSSVTLSINIALMLVNIVFSIGVVFRQLKRLFCLKCLTEDLKMGGKRDFEA